MRHNSYRRRTAIAASCLATAAVVGLAACGSENGGRVGTNAASGTPDGKPRAPFAGLSGAEIAAKAIKATSSAKSFRMTGNAPSEASGLDSLDMAYDATGTCRGWIGKTHTGSMKLVISGETVYRKYDEAILRATGSKESAYDVEAAVDLLAGRWAKTSATSREGKAFAKFCDSREQLARYIHVGATARRGGATTVDGTPAIKIIESVGTDEITHYVATKGKPYLLKVDQVSGGKREKYALTFSDYDKPVKAKPPTGEVLDLDKPAS
ncbi:hypothetical protein [Streptomyces sp. NPDC047071]|uniref:hypothetical protein n=1 Tax=Streptomyces sp. NPDC047071 TaxID=3154808 RepID=UPI0034543343